MLRIIESPARTEYNPLATQRCIRGSMSPPQFSDEELEAYLDEALDPEQARLIELQMRSDATLIARLSQINRRRDAGVHTLGEIWRTNQIGVPDSNTLGQFLLGVLPPEQQDYVEFRVEVLRCPFTIARLKDLKQRQAAADERTESRRKKYYHSSAGLLKKKPRPNPNRD